MNVYTFTYRNDPVRERNSDAIRTYGMFYYFN